MRDIDAGQGHFGGQQPFMITFGLGDVTKIDSLIVRWPDKNCTQTLLVNIPIDRTIIVTKDSFRIVADVASDKKMPKLALFPNPTKHEIFVKGDDRLAGIVEIYSMLGQCVAKVDSAENQSNELHVSVPNLENGVYLFRLVAPNKAPVESFFIVQK